MMKPEVQDLIKRLRAQIPLGMSSLRELVIGEAADALQAQAVRIAELEAAEAAANDAYAALVEKLHVTERRRDEAARNNRESVQLYAHWRQRAERAECALLPAPATQEGGER